MNDIVCPKCGHIFDDPEDTSRHVTYWGENEPKEEECPNCEAKLLVEEFVSRTFEVTVKE